MSALSGSQRFVTDDALEVTEVPDGFVIYDEPRDKIHYLNRPRLVYTLCDGNKTVSEIRAFLRAPMRSTRTQSYELFADLEQSGLCRASIGTGRNHILRLDGHT